MGHLPWFLCIVGTFVPNCIYLVVPPELGKPVWVNDSKDFGFLVFPLDVGLVAAVGEELVHVIPQQPAVWALGRIKSHRAPTKAPTLQGGSVSNRAARVSNSNKYKKSPELTFSTFVGRSQNPWGNYNFSGVETEAGKQTLIWGINRRETDGQTGQATISFPQGTKL